MLDSRNIISLFMREHKKRGKITRWMCRFSLGRVELNVSCIECQRTVCNVYLCIRRVRQVSIAGSRLPWVSQVTRSMTPPRASFSLSSIIKKKILMAMHLHHALQSVLLLQKHIELKIMSVFHFILKRKITK